MQAVNRQYEESLTSGSIDRVEEVRTHENLVLNLDGSQLTGAHAHQGVMRGWSVVLPDLPTAVFAFLGVGLLGCEKIITGREEELLPGLGGRDEIEIALPAS